MIHEETGLTITAVYSEIESLINWSIKLTAKNGRETISNDIPMIENDKASRRYYLEWTVPVLTKIEYDYEISADGILIDKGILRRK